MHKRIYLLFACLRFATAVLCYCYCFRVKHITATLFLLSFSFASFTWFNSIRWHSLENLMKFVVWVSVHVYVCHVRACMCERKISSWKYITKWFTNFLNNKFGSISPDNSKVRNWLSTSCPRTGHHWSWVGHQDQTKFQMRKKIDYKIHSKFRHHWHNYLNAFFSLLRCVVVFVLKIPFFLGWAFIVAVNIFPFAIFISACSQIERESFQCLKIMCCLCSSSGNGWCDKMVWDGANCAFTLVYIETILKSWTFHVMRIVRLGLCIRLWSALYSVCEMSLLWARICAWFKSLYSRFSPY